MTLIRAVYDNLKRSEHLVITHTLCPIFKRPAYIIYANIAKTLPLL
jgi:hypothetical protein